MKANNKCTPTPLKWQILEDGGVEVETVVLPDGEEFKSLEVLTKVLDKALSSRLDRKTTFVALGGGVIGDMVGFAAAIYQRGVKFVQVRVRVRVCFSRKEDLVGYVARVIPEGLCRVPDREGSVRC